MAIRRALTIKVRNTRVSSTKRSVTLQQTMRGTDVKTYILHGCCPFHSRILLNWLRTRKGKKTCSRLFISSLTLHEGIVSVSLRFCSARFFRVAYRRCAILFDINETTPLRHVWSRPCNATVAEKLYYAWYKTYYSNVI